MGKPKSQLAKTLDGIQHTLRPRLAELGFRVRGRTFNRVTGDGLTEVLQLQMGSFDPPGTAYIPGLRENLYGMFTVNVGVHVPEVAMSLIGVQPRSFVQEYNCCVRTRLGALAPDHKEVWWYIRQDDRVITDVWKRIRRDAFPFLERFESRDAILGEWTGVAENPDIGFPPRIVCAVILAARGGSDEAQKLLAAQANETSNAGHAAYVRTLARKLGLGDLKV